jgi:glycosyltransferase involved in cell wall biosynthesis
MKLKIAVVIHGRFHGFDLVRALLQRGHNVTLFTNYPKWAVERFDVPGECVRSFWWHGVLTRVAWKLHQQNLFRYREAWLHSMFGRWVSAELIKERWDIVHPWSGVAEEVLCALAGKSGYRIIMRGSAHIRTQARLLEEEESRTGVPQDRPSPWIIAREERAYALADAIVVLSTFARDTFVAEGVPPEKLLLLPLGARLDAFCPAPAVVEARCQRILSGEPLRVLYVGTVSFRKGMWDMAAIIRKLSHDNFHFRFVGPLSPEASQMVSTLRDCATFLPKIPQSELPAMYAWGDVFVFPTIEDGYAVVLAQASASGLPILTTTNCAGPDLIREGETGWVLPIRAPDTFIERLQWCAAHRTELAAMAHRIPAVFQPRDWTDVAADFESLCLACLQRGR